MGSAGSFQDIPGRSQGRFQSRLWLPRGTAAQASAIPARCPPRYRECQGRPLPVMTAGTPPTRREARRRYLPSWRSVGSLPRTAGSGMWFLYSGSSSRWNMLRIHREITIFQRIVQTAGPCGLFFRWILANFESDFTNTHIDYPYDSKSSPVRCQQQQS